MLSALVIGQSSARVEAAPIAIIAPSELANGQKFRIMVVTSAVTNAFSTDINYYNGFVSGALDYTYLGAPVTWKAWGSTQATSAANNLGAWDSAVDVWRNDGTTKISTGGTFFTTNHLAAVQDYTNSSDRVWSGFYVDGSAVPDAWLGRASGQGVQTGFAKGRSPCRIGSPSSSGEPKQSSPCMAYRRS